jgi:hypothetical protein
MAFALAGERICRFTTRVVEKRRVRVGQRPIGRVRRRKLGGSALLIAAKER